jgi:site-specific recombinase XerD
MKNPKVKAVLFQSKVYRDGTSPIMIRITKDRKPIYRSTGFSVPPEAWDQDNCTVFEKKPNVTKRQEGQLNSEKLLELKGRYSCALILPNAKHINSNVSDLIAEVLSSTQKLRVNDQEMGIESLRKMLRPEQNGARTISFITYAHERTDKLFKSGQINTYKRYRMIVNRLESYLKFKDIKFSEITPRFLEDYEAYLITEDFKANSIHNHLKTIRAIYYSAIKEEIISQDKNPFFVYKLRLDKNTKKQKLNIKDIQAIIKLSLDQHTLVWHVRNFFLFSFYCAGIRVSDLIQLKWENVTKSNRLEYSMEKTGSQKSIALVPKAREILDFYRNHKKANEFIFPLINITLELKNPVILNSQISSKTALINKYLKKIAALAEIEIPLTTHIARHSFADIARKQGTDLYDISKMLGHSSLKMTETYLASLDTESQDLAHERIFDF